MSRFCLKQKWGSLSSGVKASVGYFFANVVASGISYLTTPIYTRILSPEDFGRVSIFMTWTTIFGMIAMFNLAGGVFNNGLLDYKDKRDEYSFSMLILSNIITFAFSILLFLLYPFIYRWIKLDIFMIVIMCINFIFQPAYLFWIGRQRFEYKYKFSVLWTILLAVLPSIFAILFILYLPINNVVARILGSEAVAIIIYIVFYIKIAKDSKFKINVKYWKFAFLFNLPLLPHYLSTYLLSSVDRIMISNIVGDSFTAYYSVAHSVAVVVTIIWTAANSSLLPYTYERCKAEDYSSISKVSITLLALFAVACILIMMIAPEIVALMATSEYRIAIYVIPPCIGGVFFQVHYSLYANILYYYKKPLYVCLGSVLALIVNIILNYFFIKKFGFIAAGYTTLVSYFFQAVIDYIGMRIVLKKNIYNMKYIGLISLMMIIIAIGFNFLYDDKIYFIIIRYTILVLFLICALIFRKKIFNIFKSMKDKNNTNEIDTKE